MKILTFTTLFPNHRQPFYSLFVRERIKVLAELCDVWVVAPVPWFPPVKFFGERYYNFSQVIKYEKQGDLDVFHPRYVTIPRIFKYLDGFFMFISLFIFIRQMKKDFSFDLIDAHWAYPDGYAAGCLAKRLNVPYTVTVRGSDINVFAKERLRGKLIIRSLMKADRIICVSKALQNNLLKVGIPLEKTEVAENGVDYQKFYPVQKCEARKYLKLPDNGHIILSVGYLHEIKGFHLIIEAMKTLQYETNQPIYFFVIGEDDQSFYKDFMYSKIAENHLQDNVFFAGPKKPEELKYWYSASDIFCLASSREGCPNVVLESLSCGTPVVATKVGGIPEIISDQELGILVERDVENIRKGIRSALQKNWDHNKIAAHARYSYSWEITASKIYKIFKGII